MPSHKHSQPDPLAVLDGGGEMGALMRAVDWAQTPLGPVATWPQSLRTVLGILLASRHPIFVWWGSELIQFYNDAYRPILGATKHPAAIGQRGRECWREIWDVIAPMIESVMERGEATFLEDSLLVLDRNGYLEECYFVYAYSPIRDEAGAVAGVFVACNETTSKVIAARRMRTLRDLADRTVRANSDAEACRRAIEVLADNRADIPFAALYVCEPGETRQLHLVDQLGTADEAGGFPCCLNLSDAPNERLSPLVQAVCAGDVVMIDDVITRFGVFSGHPWPEAPQRALALPIHDTAHTDPIGVFIVGLSPRLPCDDDYRGFCDLVVEHLGTAIAQARTAEAERRRAAALAELNQAKTTFFSNISHEFRTPLTLLLGPTEEALAQTSDPMLRERLTMVQRNALRLQKLVNMLLDFSRIEAGRLQARYQPVDLAALTAELSGGFRSVIETAGLELIIDCPPLDTPIYVDPDLYEKIVLNLISNAFKFTPAGRISVSLHDLGDAVALWVNDTGSGIAPDRIDRIFERFYRVADARGRTHEGTGIGLALVQELVTLHGGTISVQSEPGRGSSFRVTFPKGTQHLPTDSISDMPVPPGAGHSALQFLDDAYHWASAPTLEGHVLPPASDAQSSPQPLIVWADDNADMREFVARLLGEHYQVVAVGNGRAALEAVERYGPDLVLADVMMPELDGIQLVRALRNDPRTQTLPIILLSARAGEQSEVDGLALGVDDYLTKPFSRRELLARVQTHLHMARLRREAGEALRRSEERTRLALEIAQVGTWSWDPTTNEVWIDARGRAICGLQAEGPVDLAYTLGLILPSDRLRVNAALHAALDPALQTRYTEEFRFSFPDGSLRWVIANGQAIFVGEGAERQAGLMLGTILDISERKQAEMALRQAHDALELRVAQRTAELQQSTQQLLTALAEKDVLLKEVHHRVKNNLQVIVSLLRLQASMANEPAVHELLRDSQSRVQAMALVHESLYQSPDLGRVPFGSYLGRLAEALLRYYPLQSGHIRLRYDLDPNVFLPIDTAVPLGLIASEVLLNSIKHAFPQQRQGRITISMHAIEALLILHIHDDGVGLAAALDVDRPLSLGLQIVTILAKQLRATLHIDREGGTGFEISLAMPTSKGPT